MLLTSGSPQQVVILLTATAPKTAGVTSIKMQLKKWASALAHCGSAENRRLSINRSQRLADHLKENAIAPERITGLLVRWCKLCLRSRFGGRFGFLANVS
jgi:hypothetical protein